MIPCVLLQLIDLQVIFAASLDLPKLRWKAEYLHGVQGVEGSNPFTPTK